MRLPPPPTSLKVLFSHLKVVWKHWNVHSLVLASFFVQIFLMFFAPLRRKTSNRLLAASLWLAYLMADWIAIMAIGVISNPCGSLTEAEVGPDTELYAFWAQFLLLHLGGPDTITALAVEDNELWMRTGLHLAVQVYGGLGIMVKSVAHSQTSLWLPTLLMFVAGVIKYVERLSSLFTGRLHEVCGRSLHPFKMYETVSRAFEYFNKFKWLYEGGVPNYTDEVAQYMVAVSPEKAFHILDLEFNLAYEAFYTKMALICKNSLWKRLRLAVTLLQVGCLVIWLFFTDKHGFKEYNNLITYTLLIGAIALDVFAFIMVHVLSQWSMYKKLTRYSYTGTFSYKMLFYPRRTWGEYWRREDAPFWVCFWRALAKQWSESIPQVNFLSMCSEDKSNELRKLMGLEKGMNQSKYVSRKWFSDHLRDFLHQDLCAKKKLRGAVENIGKVKGGWACHNLISNYETGMINIPFIFQLVDINRDYFKVLVRWHIITELCYQGDHMNLDNDILDDNFVAILSTGNDSNSNNATDTDGSDNKINYREICKTLSDYLMYLLSLRQDMMSLPHNAGEDLNHLYRMLRSKLRNVAHDESLRPYLASQFKCQLVIYGGETSEEFHGLEILRELEELEKKQIDKWRFMAEVWGELLYYAAINCDPKVHLTNVKQGGELLSFVWMLLVHCGFGFSKSPNNLPTKALLHAIEDCKLPP